MRTSSAILLFAFSIVAANAQDFGKPNPRAKDVALVQLLSSPQKYNHREVRVFGIYYWSHDGSYLFITREHYEAYDIASAVEIPVADKYLPVPRKEAEKLSGRGAILEGTFEATGGTNGGPMLIPITRIILLGGAADGSGKR